ncbi:MAG: GNAT family N-acetyltransferase [Brevundimonas sp.]|uniref:GNAT family N-acetyltransferase n=1 Tax=Brevundimonas sp. TaxID=1871086 RepID=UPI0024894E90|nr:GNAT family N-acetyltransferase [Brevundimonas sp.]MDI1328414.1 GNAT family N-acetyltransferase [Brevundimonas sp.]
MAHISLRPLSLADAPAALALMRRAEGGLGRLPDEMELPWMEQALTSALDGGLAIGAWEGARLVGLIKASRMPSVQFQHVLWDLTVAVDPASQGRGTGHRLFSELLANAATLTPRIERVELVVREGLTHAIRLYERVGFRQEGRFERRFRLSDGSCQADIPMALFL